MVVHQCVNAMAVWWMCDKASYFYQMVAFKINSEKISLFWKLHRLNNKFLPNSKFGHFFPQKCQNDCENWSFCPKFRLKTYFSHICKPIFAPLPENRSKNFDAKFHFLKLWVFWEEIFNWTKKGSWKVPFFANFLSKFKFSPILLAEDRNF